MSHKDTKERILDAAEQLFAVRGFAETSLRGITTEADANLAAVNYHFGTKEALIEAVFERRLGPLNRERLSHLDRIEAENDEADLPLDEVIEAFVGPALRMGLDPGTGAASFMTLLGRTLSEPSDKIETIFYAQFREVARRFLSALQRALPGLPQPEIGWRMLFMIGSLAHTMAHAHRVPPPFRQMFEGADVEQVIDRLVPFLVAGFRSEPPAGFTEGRS